ncbi:MAG: MFS transporter [Thermoleophilia bacterium]
MRRANVAILIALFASALPLRPQIIGVGPLIPAIQDDLDVSHAVAGLLPTIPVLCLGLFAPVTPYVLGRLGSRRSIALCLGLIGLFGVGRALAPGIVAVVLLTFGVGLGMGILGAVMPIAVKERFSHRPAFGTGVYSLGINLGAAGAAAAAVPLANATWGWRGTFTVISALTAFIVVVWLWLSRGEQPHTRTELRPPRLPWRSSIAWRMTGIFFLMSVVYYGMSAWLPDAFQERGWSESSAGALLSVAAFSALPTTLVIPFLADRMWSRRTYFVVLFATTTLALVGFAAIPGAAWGWAVLVGLSIGGLFPMLMTLPLDVADRPAEVGAVAGMMLGVGYTLSSLSPFVLGAIRDATGSYAAALWVLVGASGVLLAASTQLTRERLRRGVRRESIAVD